MHTTKLCLDSPFGARMIPFDSHHCETRTYEDRLDNSHEKEHHYDNEYIVSTLMLYSLLLLCWFLFGHGLDHSRSDEITPVELQVEQEETAHAYGCKVDFESDIVPWQEIGKEE